MTADVLAKKRIAALRLARAAAFGMAFSLAIGATSLAQTCPGGSNGDEDSDAGAASEAPRARGKSSPTAAALQQGRQLVEAGRAEDAIAHYKAMAAKPADRRHTAARARLRLAQVYLKLDRYDEAEAMIRAVSGSSAPADLKAGANRLLERVAYRRGADAANLDLRAIDTLIDQAEANRGAMSGVDAGVDLSADVYEGDGVAIVTQETYDKARAAYRALLQRSCPISSDFYDRVRLRLAALELKQGDPVAARKWLSEIDARSTDERLAARAIEMNGRVTQLEVDLKLRTDFAAARAVSTTSPSTALRAIDDLLAAQPPPGQELRRSALFYKADLLARTNKLSEARSIITSVRAEPEVGEAALARAALISTRIEAREVDARGEAYLANADDLARRGRIDQAVTSYEAMIAETAPWPLRWRQRAALRLANLHLRQDHYVAARQALDRPFSSATEGATGERESVRKIELLDRLNAETPDRLVLASLLAEVGFDSNAPAVTAFLRGEDELSPFLRGQDYPDTYYAVAGSAEYRWKVNPKYDYWFVSGALSVAKQQDLGRLDRDVFRAGAGRIIRLPEHRTTLTLETGARQSYRGGDFLSREGVVVTSADRRIGYAWIGSARYEVGYLDHTRDVYDGWGHELAVDLARVGRGPSLSAIIGRNGAQSPNRRAKYYQFVAQYDRNLLTSRLGVISGGLEASYRRSVYDESADPTSSDPRKTTRWLVGASLDLALPNDITARLKFQNLNLDSTTGIENSNEKITFGISKRY